MTEYFDFLGLPTLVQELIAAEIVHNSIPENRVQFALTCKAFNELVKQAKPKKILPSVCIGYYDENGTIGYTTSFPVYDDITVTELEELLRNAQIQILTLTPSIFSDEFKHHVEFLNVFHEATKFVTTLRMEVSFASLNSGFLDFYEKLKYLKRLDFEGRIEEFVKLSKIPSDLKLSCHRHHTDFSVLAEKLANVQLFELHFNQFLTKKVCQELFESVKFKDDAKIQFQYYSLKNNEYAVHMRCIGQDLFEIECFSCRPRFCRPRGRSGPSRSNKDFAITTAIIKSDMLVETLKKLDDSQV